MTLYPMSETNKHREGEDNTSLSPQLTDDERKILDILLTAERRYFDAHYKRINGSYFDVEWEVCERNPNRIRVMITHGVCGEDMNSNRKWQHVEYISRDTWRWETNTTCSSIRRRKFDDLPQEGYIGTKKCHHNQGIR